MHRLISDYVLKRKSGEVKSKMPDGADLLSLFLENQDVFTDDNVVDELVDFFTASTQTSQFALQTLTS